MIGETASRKKPINSPNNFKMTDLLFSITQILLLKLEKAIYLLIEKRILFQNP